MRNSVAFAALLLAAWPAPAAPVAPASPVALEIAGALPKTGPVTLDELKALGAGELTWTSHGQTHRVAGVRLDKLLVARGFSPGPMGKDVPKADKRAGWRKLLLATAADGFQALLSCAEIAEEMGNTVAVLAWEMDGAPLPADKGPLRLVVLSDKEPSRSIFALRRVEILDVTELVKRKP